MHEHTQQQIKMIGQNGQISLGKSYAGQVVSVSYDKDACAWTIQAGNFIPESQKWIHTSENLNKLEAALKWTRTHKPRDNFEEIAKKFEQ